MQFVKYLLIILILSIIAIAPHAQELSDSDLLITELFSADFPSDDGTISLVEGISGDYQLLSYNILGNLDENLGRDGASILVKHTDEGTDYYLYAILSVDSFPLPVAYTFLGTDIVLLNLSITDEAQITVDFVAQGEENSYLTSRKSFVLSDGALNIVFDGDLDEGHPFIADDVLSVEELSNITYALDWFDYPLAMVDGTVSYFINLAEPTQAYTYTLDTEHIAYGDLNGDGLEDALVYIAWSVEGYEGASSIIAAVLNYHGYPQFADVEVDRMGSPSRLEELSIAEDGSITFNFTDLSHQQLVEGRFILENGLLVRQ